MYQMQDQAKYPPPPPQYETAHMPPVQQIPPPMMQQGLVQQNLEINNITTSSPNPVQAKCPNCNNIFTTQIKAKAGTNTWVMCFLLSCTVGCCCIPFCIDDCKDKVHHCPKCQTVLGTYQYKICRKMQEKYID